MSAPRVPSAKALGKRKMQYTEDGREIISVAPLSVVPVAAKRPVFMAAALAAGPRVPNTTLDNTIAQDAQEEEDAVARLHRVTDAENDDLFGGTSDEDNENDGWYCSFATSPLRATNDENDNESDESVNVSQSVRRKRAFLQQQLFGADSEGDCDAVDALGVIRDGDNGTWHAVPRSTVVKLEVEEFTLEELA